MAARLNRRQQDSVRENIRASQIVNRLQDHVQGKVELSPTQIQAARILLDKCVPNLASIDQNVTGEVLYHVATGVPVPEHDGVSVSH
jgi:hypothetical protein